MKLTKKQLLIIIENYLFEQDEEPEEESPEEEPEEDISDEDLDLPPGEEGPPAGDENLTGGNADDAFDKDKDKDREEEPLPEDEDEDKEEEPSPEINLQITLKESMLLLLEDAAPKADIKLKDKKLTVIVTDAQGKKKDLSAEAATSKDAKDELFGWFKYALDNITDKKEKDQVRLAMLAVMEKEKNPEYLEDKRMQSLLNQYKQNVVKKYLS